MTDMTIASHGISFGAVESAAVTRLMGETARAWLRSFAVSSGVAEQRLVAELRAALQSDALQGDYHGSLQEMLDHAAHDAIASWLGALAGASTTPDSNLFAKLRCAFLSANVEQGWSDRFLDREHPNKDLAIALSVQMMCPTPALKACVMPRQSLERHAVAS